MGLINKTNINIEKNKTKEELEADIRIAETKAEASKSADRIIAEAQIEKEQKDDSRNRPWAHEHNFYTDGSISKIVFPENIENTNKTVEVIISRKKKELKDYIDKELNFNFVEYAKFMIYGWIIKIPTIVQGILGNPKIVSTVRPSMDKIHEGMKKLKDLDNYETNYNAAHLNAEIRELEGYLKTIQSNTQKTLYIKVGLTIALWAILIISAGDTGHHHH